MTKTKLVLLVCFIATLAAGIAAGMAFSGPNRRPHPRPDPLNLSPEQREKMRQIWSSVESKSRAGREQMDALRKEREEAVIGLLNGEQKAQYDAIIKTHDEKMAALAAERRKAIEEAVQRTKEILNDEQRAKYDEMLKKRAGWGRRGRSNMGAPEPGGPKPPHGGERPPMGEPGP